jgi:hypothetical protein
MEDQLFELPLMNVQDRIDRFIRGLKDVNIKAQVLLKKPLTLQEAIQFAEVLDSLFFSMNDYPVPIPTSDQSDTAMDLDYAQPEKRLTFEEKKILRESGGCVYCRSRDHPLDACPKLAAKNRKALQDHPSHVHLSFDN